MFESTLIRLRKQGLVIVTVGLLGLSGCAATGGADMAALKAQVDAASADLKKQFTEHFVSRVESLQAELSKHAIPVIPMNTIDNVLQQVQSAIGERMCS